MSSPSDSQLDDRVRLNAQEFNIPSPKSQSPKKDPPPKTRRPVLNPAASPRVNRLARPPRLSEEDEGAASGALEDDRCQSPTPITRRKKPRSPMSSVHTHVLARQSYPTPPLLQAPIVATIQVDIDESLLKQGKKRISRRQSGLITVGSGNSSFGSTTSSSAKSRATSPPPRSPRPAFGSPLRRDVGLAEEEDAGVHGHRRVDADEDTELERASSRGKKKHTIAQAQAEEVPVEEGGREREKRRIREDFEVAARRLQDVTSIRDSRVSSSSRHQRFRKTKTDEPPAEDTDSDIPSSALTYASTRLPLRQHLLTSPHRAIRVRHQYPFQVRTPMHRRWAEKDVYARASTMPSQSSTPRCATGSRDAGETNVVGWFRRNRTASTCGYHHRTATEVTPAITHRRRRGSDGAQADEEPFAGSRGVQRTGLSNIDTRRRSAVVNASRRSLIEDDEGRRHSMLV